MEKAGPLKCNLSSSAKFGYTTRDQGTTTAVIEVEVVVVVALMVDVSSLVPVHVHLSQGRKSTVDASWLTVVAMVYQS